MPADEIVTVKGSPVRSLQKFFDAELTRAQKDSVLSTLPDPWRERLRGPILPTETVPVSVLNKMTEEAAKAKAAHCASQVIFRETCCVLMGTSAPSLTR